MGIFDSILLPANVRAVMSAIDSLEEEIGQFPILIQIKSDLRKSMLENRAKINELAKTNSPRVMALSFVQNRCSSMLSSGRYEVFGNPDMNGMDLEKIGRHCSELLRGQT